MKLAVTVHATVYKTRMNEMKDRQTGQVINWYQIILDQGDDVGTFTCTEDVFTNARRGVECDLLAEYDDQNKRFKIISVVPNSDADMTRPSADSFINAGVPVDTAKPQGADTSTDNADTDKPQDDKPADKPDKGGKAGK